MIRCLQKVVPVKIENIGENETTQSLQKQFKVMGAPTIILFDPQSKQECKRWGGELYNLSIEEFIQQLESNN